VPPGPLAFRTAEEWDRWLERHHDEAGGVWLKLARKGSGIESVAYPEVLEVALAHGWIDARRQALDADWYLQRFTPRRPRSRWSKLNRETAEALVAAGRMRARGLREVERAKADGRWDAAYAGQRSAVVPEDLAEALDRDDRAKAFFESLDSRNRYAVLYRIGEAKRPETRARRIARFVEMLARGERVYP